jgi:hypothetical protein
MPFFRPELSDVDLQINEFEVSPRFRLSTIRKWHKTFARGSSIDKVYDTPTEMAQTGLSPYLSIVCGATDQQKEGGSSLLQAPRRGDRFRLRSQRAVTIMRILSIC